MISLLSLEHNRFLLFLQETANESYPEPAESIPHHRSIPPTSFLILSTHLFLRPLTSHLF